MPVKPTTSPSGGGTAVISGRMVVAHRRDGQLIKGTTQNFTPNRPTFHVYKDGDENSMAIALSVDELKAIFFVKSFTGSKSHVPTYDFETTRGYGRKCSVTFEDGEVISGYTSGYNPGRAGFFLIPAEAENNNERIFVVNKAVKQLNWV